MSELQEWQQRHGVSVSAMTELLTLLAMPPDAPRGTSTRSEAAGQSEIRLAATQWGGVLWRNNVGVWDDDGVPVRYGLANDSAKLNKKVKSSDLIGMLPMIIGQEHVGKMLAVFCAIECKRAAWKWGGNLREVAQQRFHNIVKASGGVAGFARDRDEFEKIVTGG